MTKKATLAAGCLSLLLLAASHAGFRMIDYWDGDGDAIDSVGPNSGILVDGVEFVPGVNGLAFQFDGDSHVEASTVGMPAGDANRTLSLWFKIDAFVAEEAFLAGYGSFGSFDSVYMVGVLSDGRVYFSQWGAAIFGPSVEEGDWHNLTVTNVGRLATLYLDGFEVGSQSMSIDTAADTSFYIGRIPGGQLGNSRRLVGSVDEVRLFRGALEADDVRMLALLRGGR